MGVDHLGASEAEEDAMRFVLFILLSVAVFVSARAQSPAQPQLPSDPSPRTGEEITIDDLQGAVITFAVAFTGSTRWSGDNIIGPTQQKVRSRMQIGPGESFRWSGVTETQIAGRWYSEHGSGSGIIGRPGTKPAIRNSTELRTRSNPSLPNEELKLKKKFSARAGLVTLEGNTLTVIRVFERGGRTFGIKLSRIGSHLSCTATGLYFREVGVGNPRDEAPVQGGYREYIGMKQTSSTCRVTRN